MLADAGRTPMLHILMQIFHSIRKYQSPEPTGEQVQPAYDGGGVRRAVIHYSLSSRHR